MEANLDDKDCLNVRVRHIPPISERTRINRPTDHLSKLISCFPLLHVINSFLFGRFSAFEVKISRLGL